MVLAAVGVGSGSSAGTTPGGGRSLGLNALGATLIFLFTFPVPISVLSESFQITAAGGPLNLRVHQPFRRTLIHRQTDRHTRKQRQDRDAQTQTHRRSRS